MSGEFGWSHEDLCALHTETSDRVVDLVLAYGEGIKQAERDGTIFAGPFIGEIEDALSDALDAYVLLRSVTPVSSIKREWGVRVNEIVCRLAASEAAEEGEKR